MRVLLVEDDHMIRDAIQVPLMMHLMSVLRDHRLNGHALASIGNIDADR
ncbi:hypothetical protein R8510_05273 [Ralstonia chuxiongensis]|nr:hypothetical protein R8510_05273 [Ralstonia chuxiongensis]